MTQLTKSLSHRDNIIALHLATGATRQEACVAAGYKSTGHLKTLEKNPLFLAAIREIKKEIERRSIDKASDVANAFNDHAAEAAEAIFMIMRAADQDSTKLAAAKEVLDRAPHAPKSQKYQEKNDEQHLHIHLPVSSMRNIRQTMSDCGEDRMIEEFDNVIDIEPEEVMTNDDRDD